MVLSLCAKLNEWKNHMTNTCVSSLNLIFPLLKIVYNANKKASPFVIRLILRFRWDDESIAMVMVGYILLMINRANEVCTDKIEIYIHLCPQVFDGMSE